MARPSRPIRDPIAVGEAGSVTDESGYLAVPTSGEGPGVLVLAPSSVPASEVRAWCDRLAREGYIAFAPGAVDAPGSPARPPSSADRTLEGDPDRALAGWMRAVDRLAQHPGIAGDAIGVLGVGGGGGPAMLLAELKPSKVRAVVVFYGADREVHFDATRAAYLGHFPDGDPNFTEDAIRSLEGEILEGGREAVFHRYPGVSDGFFEVSHPAHDVEAEAMAWSRTLEFLRDRLAPG
ncbi:MAG: dienelactone hydrolase family protein [Thermoplasmata archaeon]